MLSETEWQALNELASLADLATPMAVRAAAKVGLPDAFGGEPATLAELSHTLEADGAKLQRLLCLLAAAGIVEERPSGSYSLTALGNLLRTDHSWSMRDALCLADIEVPAWLQLEHAVRTCTSAFEKAFGEPHRRFRAREADEDVRMDKMHQAASRVDLFTLSRAYPWGNVGTVADVGGGTGAFLGGILQKYPSLRGTLFDLRRMLERAPEVLRQYEVLERCSIMAGDFFESVPADHDLYVLKAVLGGWDDSSCERILRNIRRAMKPDSRLLIIEPLMGSGAQYMRGNLVQLHLLVLYGGKFRDVEAYHDLARRAELQVVRVIPRSTLPILELQPA